MAAADMVYLPPSLSPSPGPHPEGCSDEDVAQIHFVVVLVVVAFVAMLLLHALGSLRRQSSHGLLHSTVMAIYTLSYPLVAYTIGRMRYSRCYVDDYAVWAVFMLLLLGSTDNLTACRLSEIDNWKSIYLRHLFKGCLVVYIVVNISMFQKKESSEVQDGEARLQGILYLSAVMAILLVGILKWFVRIASMRMVSKSYLSKSMKLIAEYMQHKADNDNNQLGLGSFDPVTMVGYRYLVAGEKYCIKSPGRTTPWYNDDSLNSKLTTVEQIWKCKGNLLHTERGGLLKDLCLSMALSKMLNRRFAGFSLSEAGLPKTHDFVFKGLLVSGDKPNQRVFRVIEEELVFVHDMYYTRYSYLYHKGRYLALCLPIIMIGLCSWLIYQIIAKSDKLLGLTIFITVVLAFLEAYQLYLYVASGWFKVALIRSYVDKSCCQTSGCFLEMIIGILLRLKAFRPWKNGLGQYCILRGLGHKGLVRNCLHYATLRLVDKPKSNKGRKKSVKLSESMKKAIVDSLLRSNGHLTNGVASLQYNGVDGHLSWACDASATDGSVTRTILVWHIATTLCKHHLEAQAKQEDTKKEDNVTTATTLSQYCMHLLAFAPNLLPDHSAISESILDESIEEAAELLKGCKKKENWCAKLMEISIHDHESHDVEASLVAKGAHLARDLIEHIQEPTQRWKVLCDFWAEMMLFVSPSDNARAHLEALAKGGEFITHLWVLLTHAGVLKRGPPAGP